MCTDTGCTVSSIVDPRLRLLSGWEEDAYVSYHTKQLSTGHLPSFTMQDARLQSPEPNGDPGVEFVCVGLGPGGLESVGPPPPPGFKPTIELPEVTGLDG